MCININRLTVLTSNFQTITGAMSTLNPPVSLEKKDNEARVEYIQDYASSKIYYFFKCMSIYIYTYKLVCILLAV